MTKIPFEKPSLTFQQQLALLADRGLIIQNEADAARCLKRIGYYRLSGYMLPYQKGGNGADRHSFKDSTSFEEILDLYVFDRKLRLLFLDAIERIEIAIRTAVSTAMALRHGSHWYLDGRHFDAEFDHADFLERAKKEIGHDDPKRRDVFIDHYYKCYSEPEMPPCWMLFEALPFGVVSMIAKKLEKGNRKAIAGQFNLPEPALRSWPHCLSYVRNLCAHHSRLWNRTFTIKPFAIVQYASDLTPNYRLYAQLVVTQVFLRKVSPDTQWSQRLAALLETHPQITPARLAFPADWRGRQVWN